MSQTIKNRFILISKDGLRQEIFDVRVPLPEIRRIIRNPVCDMGLFITYRTPMPPPMEYSPYDERIYKQSTTSTINIGDTLELIHFYREA